MDAPDDGTREAAAEPRRHLGRNLVYTATGLFVGTRLIDLWLAHQHGRELPWLQLVVAVYFAARLVSRGAPARWIAALVALIWVYFDWQPKGIVPALGPIRMGLIAADLATAALLIAGPGVGAWFRDGDGDGDASRTAN